MARLWYRDDERWVEDIASAPAGRAPTQRCRRRLGQHADAAPVDGRARSRWRGRSSTPWMIRRCTCIRRRSPTSVGDRWALRIDGLQIGIVGPVLGDPAAIGKPGQDRQTRARNDGLHRDRRRAAREGRELTTAIHPAECIDVEQAARLITGADPTLPRQRRARRPDHPPTGWGQPGGRRTRPRSPPPQGAHRTGRRRSARPRRRTRRSGQPVPHAVGPRRTGPLPRRHAARRHDATGRSS